jgi:hypothetical protein
MQFTDARNSHRALISIASVSLTLLSAPVFAEQPLPQVERLKTSPVLQHLKPNPMPAPPKTPAEQTLAQMYVPEGFRVELVAVEPDLHQPIAFTFDERGRIWVAEAYSYPAKRPAGQGLDKIVIFEDRDGDGKFETQKVFAEKLNLVSGLEVGYGGVWVGAAPELLFIPDKNHDDVPDGPPQVLLDGFGYQDTHECLNSFSGDRTDGFTVIKACSTPRTSASPARPIRSVSNCVQASGAIIRCGTSSRCSHTAAAISGASTTTSTDSFL